MHSQLLPLGTQHHCGCHLPVHTLHNSSNYVAMYGGTLANFLELQMWRLYRKFNNRLLLFYQEVAYAVTAVM